MPGMWAYGLCILAMVLHIVNDDEGILTACKQQYKGIRIPQYIYVQSSSDESLLDNAHDSFRVGMQMAIKQGQSKIFFRHKNYGESVCWHEGKLRTCTIRPVQE